MGYWIMLSWGIGGFICGLFAANYYYADPDNKDSTESGQHALEGFCLTLALFPLILAIGACYFLVLGGAWLLPAYREDQRKKRAIEQLNEEKNRLNETDKLRKQVNELHRKIGISEVDWTGEI
jgi:hypothetical protein